MSSEEDESEEETRSVQGAMAGAATAGTAAAGEPGGELLTILKDFLAVQHRREEKMLAEFQGLRASLTKTEQLPPPVPPNVTTVPAVRGTEPRSTLATPSTLTAASPRLELPTPAPRRVHRDALSGEASFQLQDSGGMEAYKRAENPVIPGG